MRIIDAMNQYEANSATTGALGVNNQLFTRSSGAQMDGPYEKTDVISFDYKVWQRMAVKRSVKQVQRLKTPCLFVL